MNRVRVLASARVGAIYGKTDVVVVHARAQRLDRASRLALAAAQQVAALADAADCGVFVLTRFGAIAANAEHWSKFKGGGIGAVSPLIFPSTVPSAAAAEVAIALQAMGPNFTLCGDASLIPELWRLAEDALAIGDCTHALVGAVDGWHPVLERFGLKESDVDGACFALLGPGDHTPHFHHDTSIVRAFDRSL